MLENLYNYYFNKSATLLNRHQLGSIDLSDVRDIKTESGLKELTENEIKERNVAIANAYKYIEPAIKKLLIAQQEFLSTHCEQTKPILFGRGSINGICVVLDEFEDYKKQYEEDTKPNENFDKFKPL